MELTKQVAKHFREVHFGGNWTGVSMKDALKDITWQQATTQVHNLNTIAMLVFHINYYTDAVLKVFRGQPLSAHDKYSFALQPLNAAEDWDKLVKKAFDEAELLAAEIEKMDEARLFQDLADPKYGNYYRNIHGIIEHTHYHTGQISLIKKILNEMEDAG